MGRLSVHLVVFFACFVNISFAAKGKIEVFKFKFELDNLKKDIENIQDVEKLKKKTSSTSFIVDFNKLLQLNEVEISQVDSNRLKIRRYPSISENSISFINVNAIVFHEVNFNKPCLEIFDSFLQQILKMLITEDITFIHFNSCIGIDRVLTIANDLKNAEKPSTCYNSPQKKSDKKGSPKKKSPKKMKLRRVDACCNLKDLVREVERRKKIVRKKKKIKKILNGKLIFSKNDPPAKGQSCPDINGDSVYKAASKLNNIYTSSGQNFTSPYLLYTAKKLKSNTFMKRSNSY